MSAHRRHTPRKQNVASPHLTAQPPHDSRAERSVSHPFDPRWSQSANPGSQSTRHAPVGWHSLRVACERFEHSPPHGSESGAASRTSGITSADVSAASFPLGASSAMTSADASGVASVVGVASGVAAPSEASSGVVATSERVDVSDGATSPVIVSAGIVPEPTSEGAHATMAARSMASLRMSMPILYAQNPLDVTRSCRIAA